MSPRESNRIRALQTMINRLIALLLLGFVGSVPSYGQSVRSQAEFWRAVEANDVGSVRFELARGIDPNSVHPEKGPAIVAAVRDKSFEVAKILASLDKTQVDKPNAADETALMFASLHGDKSVADLLIQRGAQVNRPGWTPLHYAATGGHPDITRWLLDEHHAFVDAQSANGTSALMMAARMKHLPVVQVLMDHGADPTLRNQAGLDVTAYLERVGELRAAEWMRERALRYIARYGTIEQPRWTTSAAPPGQDKEPAGNLLPIPMTRDSVLGADSRAGAAPALRDTAPRPAPSPSSIPSPPAAGIAPRPAAPASPPSASSVTRSVAPAPAAAPAPIAAPARAAPPAGATPTLLPPTTAPVGAAPRPPIAPKPPQVSTEPADAAPMTFSRTLSIPNDAPPPGSPGPRSTAVSPAPR